MSDGSIVKPTTYTQLSYAELQLRIKEYNEKNNTSFIEDECDSARRWKYFTDFKTYSMNNLSLPRRVQKYLIKN